MAKTRIVNVDISQLKRSPEQQLKEIENRLFHMYAQTDGTYCIPNSCEGDIIKMTVEYIALKKQESKNQLPKFGKIVVKNINGYEIVSYICPDCNWNVSLSNKFCLNCGQKLAWK